MGDFTVRALWESRWATAVAGHRAGEPWRVEAAYDFAAEAPPRDGGGRPLPGWARPGCPPRRDHGVPVVLVATLAGDEPRECGGGRRGGEAVPLLGGCATLRHNVGDKAHTEGAWALEWREAGADFSLRLGRAAEALPDARERLLAAGAAARAWARQGRDGFRGAERPLAAQQAAAEAALAVGRSEAGAPPACR